jgi:hypothetical protein
MTLLKSPDSLTHPVYSHYLSYFVHEPGRSSDEYNPTQLVCVEVFSVCDLWGWRRFSAQVARRSPALWCSCLNLGQLQRRQEDAPVRAAPCTSAGYPGYWHRILPPEALIPAQANYQTPSVQLLLGATQSLPLPCGHLRCIPHHTELWTKAKKKSLLLSTQDISFDLDRMFRTPYLQDNLEDRMYISRQKSLVTACQFRLIAIC